MRIGIFIPDEGLRLTSGWKKYKVRNRSNRNMGGAVPKIEKKVQGTGFKVQGKN
jgi:hypothetical protein